ncbi:tyrosine-type recombinase/integrase [Pectinatus sottacetonis]|uniref:tyrosine-type recombinase/integrase n=1 Tax=Pectinatus sottacetonis TaxID=1002795 RepID=UPI0018C5BE9D|nr:site-specific integrase [Pectinatus sottacetonis]
MEKFKYITYREKRNSYQIKINIKTKNGMQSVVRTAKTLANALKIRTEMMKLYKLDTKLLLSVDKALKNKTDTENVLNDLLVDALKNWYTIYKKSYLEIQSQRKYETLLFKVIAPIFQTFKVKQITQDIIQSYVNSLYKRNLSTSYIRSIIKLLKQFYATVDGMKNPCNNIIYKKDIRKPKVVLTSSEKNKLLLYVKDHKPEYYFLYYLYFATGCRCGELLGLTWSNVNFADNAIHIEQTLIYNHNTKQHELKDYPKNKSSIRDIFLSPKCMFYLHYIKNQYKSNELVFCKNNGRPYSLRQVSSNFTLCAKLAGINKHVVLHSTRHYFATQLINNDVSIPVIQSLGGWNTPNTLMNVYAHSNVLKERQAMKKVVFNEL